MPQTVEEIMTRDVLTLREEDNLENVAAGLDTYKFRHLPVVDGPKVVGLITERDLLRLTVSSRDRTSVADARERRIEQDTFVSAVMTPDPMVVQPSTTVAEAAKLMADGRIGCLPVVEGDERTLVGIVTQHDLLEVLVRVLQEPERAAS